MIDRISCEGRKLLNLHRLLSTHIEIGMPVCYVQIQIKICRGYVIPYFLCINIPNFTILINSKKMIQFMLPLRQFLLDQVNSIFTFGELILSREENLVYSKQIMIDCNKEGCIVIKYNPVL